MLGDSVNLSPAVTTPSFFDVGGVNGNVLVVGGLDNASPYPWPQTLGLIAKPAAAADFNTAFVHVQAVDSGHDGLAASGQAAGSFGVRSWRP